MSCCVDCGSDISGLPARSYLCLQCGRVRRAAAQRRWHIAMLADPIRHARRLDRQRAHWRPRPLKTTPVPCVAQACTNTFLRRWPRNNQKFCSTCSPFYAREAVNDAARRHRRRAA